MVKLRRNQPTDCYQAQSSMWQGDGLIVCVETAASSLKKTSQHCTKNWLAWGIVLTFPGTINKQKSLYVYLVSCLFFCKVTTPKEEWLLQCSVQRSRKRN